MDLDFLNPNTQYGSTGDGVGGGRPLKIMINAEKINTAQCAWKKLIDSLVTKSKNNAIETTVYRCKTSGQLSTKSGIK